METLEGRQFFSSVAALAVQPAVADVHPAVPAYSSRPGAAYTVYLDFAGFNYTGDWNGQGNPGTNAAYDTDGDPTTFSAQDNAAIGKVWATVAGKYAGLSVNVTTVDPYLSQNDATPTDVERQAFYDNTAGVLHTVIGGNGGWDGGSGLGVSQLDVARNAYGNPSTNNGVHTNWIYSGLINGDTYYTAGGSAHENGHAFGLFHQSDVTPGQEEEYDAGEPASALTASYSPIMGGQDGQTRNLWRNGTVSDGTFQNDIAVLLSNPNMTLTEDGIGHTLSTATALGLNGSNVDSTKAKGYINTSNPANPLGIANYTTDYFKFNTSGSALNLVLNAGADRDGDGQIDPGATFDGSFNILDAGGNVVASSVRGASSLSYTYNGTLAAGSYYAQVLNFGGYASPREAGVSYFTSGDYFFTGSGFSGTVTPPPTNTKTPFIFINNPRVYEGNNGLTAMTFTVTLSKASTQKIEISWKLKDGTAKAGKDYVNAVGKVTFKPGQTTQTFTVYVKTNTIKEPNKSFTALLFNARNARFGDSTGIGTIVNDDKFA